MSGASHPRKPRALGQQKQAKTRNRGRKGEESMFLLAFVLAFAVSTPWVSEDGSE